MVAKRYTKLEIRIKRATGYYWISFSNTEFVAYWSNITDEWLLAGDWEGLKDTERVQVLSPMLRPPVRVRG